MLLVTARRASLAFTLGVILAACTSHAPDRQNAPCPAIFPVPGISAEPTSVRAGESVDVTVTVLKANEACYAYRINRIDYLVNGSLLTSQQVDNTDTGIFTATWEVQAGRFGVPSSGEHAAAVSARVYSGSILVDAQPRNPRLPGEAHVTVHVTVP